MTKLRNALLLGGGCLLGSSRAFTTPSPRRRAAPAASPSSPASASGEGSRGRGCRRGGTELRRTSNGFVGFRGDDNPIRGYGGDGGGSGGGYSPPPINGRRPMDDPFAPSPPLAGTMGVDPMRGRVVDRGSNLSPYDRRSVGEEDPRVGYDAIDRRYSQMPHPGALLPPHAEQMSRGGHDDRIQGGSRRTYQRHPLDGGGGRTFVETDGRPLDVEVEVWEGPNNTPTRVRMYSEDGRSRPMNILTGNLDGSGRGGTTSVRNVGSMEFPIRGGVTGGYGGGGDYGYGAPLRSIGSDMMSPSGIRPHGSNNPYTGDASIRPSSARGETVQGGALKTFTLPSHVNAVQVTITSDGLPVNAKVELWGTSSHIKQLAEVYNDNGQTRPFAAIVDVPGGENTIAVRNTGPMEYPIRVSVEPVGGPGRGGGMMDDMMMMPGGGYGCPPPPMPPPMGMMGRDPPMGGPYLPPPPF